MKTLRWLLGSLMISGALAVHAENLITDDFNYTGALTNNGWVAYSGADGSITSDGDVAQVGSGAEDIRLEFADQLTGPTYASFVINVQTLPTSGSEYSYGFVDGINSMESRFGIISVSGTAFRVGAWGAGSSVSSTSPEDLSLNTDYLITVYFDGVDDHRLWVDGTSTAFATPDAQATAANSGIDGFFIRQAGTLDAGAASWTMNDLIVATTFEDVVPAGGPPPTNVSFTVSSASVNEDAGTYEVTITKSLSEGDVSGEIALSGTATEGADYTIDTTNFVMNGATTSATITVTVIDDEDQEAGETVVLTLANVIGGDMVNPSEFTLTINDNDTISAIIISQYTDTDSGTSPKGIEVWNVSGSDITFDSETNLLAVLVGVNGGALSTNVTISSGTLPDGDVWVIGTSDMTPDIEQGFTFNGDDALAIALGGIIQDVFGEPGVDPGSAWSGSGVSTADQNIQLKEGITNGALTGWSDPSERFETVDIGSVLTGFGVAPGGAPPSDLPPTISLDPDGSPKTVQEGNLLTFNVSASQVAADAADETTLISESLPAGATFDGVTNLPPVMSTFSWTPSETGTFNAVFVASDKDGAVTQSVEIVVTPIPEPPAGALVYFTFTGETPTPEFVAPNLTGDDLAISADSISYGSANSASWTGSGVPYAIGSGGWTNPVQDEFAKRFEVNLEAETGYVITVTNISVTFRSTGAGPSAVGLAINGDNADAVDAPDSINTDLSTAITGYENLDVVTVFIQGWDNGSRVTSGGGQLQIDDVLIQGTVALDGGGPVEPDVVGFSMTATGVGATVTTETGFTYSLEYTTDPVADPVVWVAADSVVGDGNDQPLDDDDPADASRIYRILAE